MILLLLCIVQLTYALEARWLGVSGILLKDDQTTLLIDPVITKPDLSHWVLNAPFTPNQDKIKNTLKQLELNQVDGVFISHCHFDHASDVAFISSYLKAPAFGGASLKKIIHHFDRNAPFVDAQDRSEFQIGNFKVKMYRRPHPAIIRPIDWHFLGGLIEKFSGNFYDYREGEVWMFIIEHPEGISIFDQSSVLFEESAHYKGRVTNYFLGVANPEDKNTIVENNINLIQPERVIAIHHDFFFLENDIMNDWILPTADLGHIESEIKRLGLKTQFIIPTKNEVIKLNP